MPDEPGPHAVLIAAHHHLRVAVHPRRQGQRGVERLDQHGAQQRLLERPILGHTVGAVSNTSFVVGVIGGRQQRVKFVDRVHHRHGHAVGTPEPAAFAFHTAFLVAALMARLAIPRLKTVVRAKRERALVLLPAAPEQHLLDRAVEVVVADLLHRDPTEALEAVNVTFQKRLLTLGQKRAVRRASRIRPPHGEQRGLGLHAAQDHPQVMKVGLRLGRPGDGFAAQTPPPATTRLSQDLRAALPDMIAHRDTTGRSRRLVDQPRPKSFAPCAVASSGHPHPIAASRRSRSCTAPAAARFAAGSSAAAGPPIPTPGAPCAVHAVPVGQRPNRQPLNPMIAADRRELLHL